MARLIAPAAVLLLAAVVFYVRQQADQADTEPDDTAPDWTDELNAALSTAKNMIDPTPAAGMSTSPAGLAHIAKFEGLSLTPIQLGDGGWTLGRGRYFPYSGSPPPDRISLETADAWFAEDVANKGEKWVRAYVSAPVTQPEFDALVSMAFNLSPKSFKTIADQVNQGNDPEVAALRFVRAGTNLERGLRNRRAAELALFRTDPNTYA